MKGVNLLLAPFLGDILRLKNRFLRFVGKIPGPVHTFFIPPKRKKATISSEAKPLRGALRSQARAQSIEYKITEVKLGEK